MNQVAVLQEQLVVLQVQIAAIGVAEAASRFNTELNIKVARL